MRRWRGLRLRRGARGRVRLLCLREGRGDGGDGRTWCVEDERDDEQHWPETGSISCHACEHKESRMCYVMGADGLCL